MKKRLIALFMTLCMAMVIVSPAGAIGADEADCMIGTTSNNEASRLVLNYTGTGTISFPLNTGSGITYVNINVKATGGINDSNNQFSYLNNAVKTNSPNYIVGFQVYGNTISGAYAYQFIKITGRYGGIDTVVTYRMTARTTSTSLTLTKIS